MEIEISPGGARSSSFNLGEFKTRLGSIDPRRCSPTALPPPPPLCEEDEDRMLAAEAQAAAAAAAVGEEAAAADASMMRRSGSSSGLAGEALADDPEPQPMGEAELRGEVARAREAFMLRRWASILAQVKASGGVEGAEDLSEGAGGSAEHLARTYASAEGGLRKAVAGCLQEEARQGQAYDRLLQRKAEVEALLGTLEKAQARLARQQQQQQQQQQQGQEGEESDGEEEDDEEDEADKAGDAETARLMAALAAAKKEKEAVDGQAAALERQLEAIKAQGRQAAGGEGQEMEEEGEEEEDADSVSTTGDEEALLQEAAALREHGEWLELLLSTLRGLYQVSVKVEEEGEEGDALASTATAGGSGSKKRTVFLRVAYPTQHALELTLATEAPTAAGAPGQAAAVVVLADACLELPPQQARRKSAAVTEAARALNQAVQALLALAKGLPAPADLMFLAREAGWLVHGKGVLRKEVRELMKRYVVRHSEASNKAGAGAGGGIGGAMGGGEELAISFNEGVVATFGLLAGYPQMPGSVRITSLVGVGGWKDGELAVTARSLNGLGLESLTALVESLQERLVELDKGV